MLEPLYPKILSMHNYMHYSVGVAVIKMLLLFQLNEFFAQFNALLLSTLATTSFMHNFRGNHGILGTLVTFLRPSYPCFANKSVTHLRALQETLHEQVHTLLERVEVRQNKRIWKALANPAKVLRAPIPSYESMGTAEEVIEIVRLFLPIFTATRKEASGIRQMLVDWVGESPDYDMTFMKF